MTMVFNSVVYLGACWLLSGLYGVRGLLYANSISMALRGLLSLAVAKVDLVALLGKVMVSKEFLGLMTAGSIANLLISKIVI